MSLAPYTLSVKNEHLPGLTSPREGGRVLLVSVISLPGCLLWPLPLEPTAAHSESSLPLVQQRTTTAPSPAEALGQPRDEPVGSGVWDLPEQHPS